jgi:hypothetical protein
MRYLLPKAVPPETRKQLLVGYFVLSFPLMLSIVVSVHFLDVWWPVRLVAWFSDPIVKFFLSLFFLAFVPGVLTDFLICGAVVICVYVALLLVLLPAILLPSFASISLGGLVLGFILVILYIIVGIKIVQQKGPEFISFVSEHVRTIVEFFAWLSVVLGRARSFVGDTGGGGSIPFSMDHMGSEPKGEENMQQDEELRAAVGAEIVNMTKRYPELPAFHDNGYSGWFNEAIKVFTMQAYNRTQDERIAVAKRIAELNDLYLRILRQQGERITFEKEQRIRGKRMDVEETELDYRMEDLQYEREKLRAERSKPPAPAPPPGAERRDPAQELRDRTQARMKMALSIIQLMAQAEADRDELKKKYPESAHRNIDSAYRKIIDELRERL